MSFRERYARGNDPSLMSQLAYKGQRPKVMVIACSDSRVDPALILQCDPGDLFVVRNVASLVPPYENDAAYHGTSAALEFGIRFLKVEHLVLLGHSQCGGMQALVDGDIEAKTDFIGKWVGPVAEAAGSLDCPDDYAKEALRQSHRNCLNFPWIQERVQQGTLSLHRWFFEVKTGKLFSYNVHQKAYEELEPSVQMS